MIGEQAGKDNTPGARKREMQERKWVADKREWNSKKILK
jgi:hypothetical protein